MYPATSPTTEDYREDLIFLRDMFPRLDRSFMPETVVTFTKRVDAAFARVASLTRAGFGMAVAHALAAPDNAHTMAVLFEWLRVVPARLHWFSDGLYVVRAATGPKELVGSRVLGVQGHAPERWLSCLREYVGGNDARRRVLSVFFLTSAEGLSSIEPAASFERLTLTFRDRSGTERTCALEPAPLTLNGSLFPRRDPYISRAPADDKLPWRQVLDDVPELPAYLRDPMRNAVHEWLTPQAALYVGIRRTADGDEFSLQSYLADVVDEARAHHIRNAVVDLRFNDGGNFLLARKFCETLPAILPADGRLFIITNNQTFSAGLLLAALLKFHGGARASIVGEPPSDRSTFWADGGVFDLPRTGLPVRCATGYYDWEQGRRDPHREPWFNLLYSVPAGSVEPNVPIPSTFADYASGRDAVMRAICDWLS